MANSFLQTVSDVLQQHISEGRTSAEKVITSSQQSVVKFEDGRELLNLCANNYLGLANHPQIVEAAKMALEQYGYGMASGRIISGTHLLHKQLEADLARYLGTEDSILFASCFDANAGLFEALLGADDAIVSDALNHASIIDGVRLCKAQRFRFRHADMSNLEEQLVDARKNGARHIMIATDGFFSMTGTIAPLGTIAELAEKYDAIVMVDDSHATGVIGPHGKGTAEFLGVADKISIITGTFGKALGGGLGGFVAASTSVVELLRRRARPYIFSNSLPPMVCAASIEAIKLSIGGDEMRSQLDENICYWRRKLEKLGFSVFEGITPIVPIMFENENQIHNFVERLFDNGIYVQGFRYPIVPKGAARIRTQISSTITSDQLDFASEVFAGVAREL